VTLPHMPSSIKNGILWVICAGLLATWAGWLEPPWVVAGRQRDEWMRAHAVASAISDEHARSIVVLQDRDTRTQQELSAIRGKLDEMAMVLYSLERRTR
jgi:hypothetical protein